MLQRWNRNAWLATWLQARRRKRHGLLLTPLPNAPAVVDLAVASRLSSGFQVLWSYTESVIYRAYYRIHGQAGWTDFGDISAGEATLDIPDATQHSFDLKVTSRGDGMTFSANEIDSNIVQTVNDSELDDAPQIDDLNVASLGDGYVDLHWSPGAVDGVVFSTLVRESPAGEWSEGMGGLLSDGGVIVDGLSNGVAYDFKIQTFGQSNQSQFKIASRVDSNVVTETPGEPEPEPPEPPTGLHVVDNFTDDPTAYASFAWTPPAGGANSYILAVVLEGNPFEGSFLYNFEISETSTELLDLTAATDYEVAVKSIKSGVESDWSASVHFTTQPI